MVLLQETETALESLHFFSFCLLFSDISAS